MANWGGILETIGGGVLTAFGGGAVGVPLMMGGISSLASSHAADQQTQASQAVQGQNRQITQGQNQVANTVYGGQQRALAPYTSLGGGAASLLGAGLGIPVTPVPTGPVNPEPGGVAPGFSPLPSGGMVSGGTPPPPGVTGVSQPRTQPTLGSPLSAAVQRQSSYGGGTVRMKAPDGTIEAVPASAVDHYKSLGAVLA